MKINRAHEYYDIVTPEEGMWLFDGTYFSDKVFTPKNYDAMAHFQEVTEAFKEQWEAEHQPKEAEL